MKVTMNLVKCADENPPKNGRYIVCDMLKGGIVYFGEDATVDEERKTGMWIEKNGMYICTACEHRLSKFAVYDVGGIYSYCPNCGAKMEVEG